MKKTYVLFSNNDAVIYNNQRPMVKKGQVLIENPDLQFVTGVSPHYWKLVDGRIFPMNQAERTLKHATHVKHYRKFNAVHWGKIGERVFWCSVFFVGGAVLSYYLIKKGIF